MGSEPTGDDGEPGRVLRVLFADRRGSSWPNPVDLRQRPLRFSGACARNPHSWVAVCRVEVAKFDPSNASTRTLGRKHPEEETGVKSPASAVESTMVLVNSGTELMRVHWIDYDGKRKHYGEICPGKRFEQKPFLGHFWLVTDADGNAWRLIRPEAKPQMFEITGPDKK